MVTTEITGGSPGGEHDQAWSHNLDPWGQVVERCSYGLERSGLELQITFDDDQVGAPAL
jgi:hypothetical protein